MSADTLADVARRNPDGYKFVMRAAEAAGLPLAEPLREAWEEAEEAGSA